MLTEQEMHNTKENNVQYLGTGCQQPFAWVFGFSVDGSKYSVCATLWDDTLTEDISLFGKYQLDLYNVHDIQYSEKWKHQPISFNLGERLHSFIHKFNKLFPMKLEKNEKGFVKEPSRSYYLAKENEVILNKVFKPYFDNNYHAPLEKMLKTYLN